LLLSNSFCERKADSPSGNSGNRRCGGDPSLETATAIILAACSDLRRNVPEFEIMKRSFAGALLG
jgi:hypothetical protein